jgi:1,4-alpha-glucan branching enzyme
MKIFLSSLPILLMLWTGSAYAVNERSRPTTFRIHAPSADTVEVIGNFNNWREKSDFLAGPDSDGVWSATIAIDIGIRRIEYRYLLNGREALDPEQPVIDDEFGGKNNFRLLP